MASKAVVKDNQTETYVKPATIFEACKRGEVHGVIEFIYKEAASDGESRLVHLVDSRDNSGDFPLHLSSRNGYNDVVNVLLDNAANVHVVNGDGDTPFHVACASGHLEIAKSLVAAGADPYCRNFKACTPLHVACTNGHIEICRFLLDTNSVDVNARAKDGSTPLYCAYEKFHRDVIRFLIENGGQSDMISRLHLYSLMGNLPKIVECLVRGSGVNSRDGYGRTPMHVASFMGFPDVVEELAKCGAYLNVKDNAQMTPFLYACKNGNILAASILLDREADHKILQTDGKNGLHLAAMFGNLDIVEAMLGIVAAIGGATGTDRFLTLEWKKRCQRRNSSEKDKKGKDLSKRSLSNRDSWASSKLDFDITKHDASSTQELCKESKTAPFRRLKDKFKKRKEKRIESAEVVSSLGVLMEFLESVDNDGRTPLLLACACGHAPVVSVLLEVGANPDASDKDDNSCIHIACQNDYTDIVVNLLQSGVKLNVKNNTGETPLHALVKNGNIALVNMFINHRVNVDAADMRKQTPLHLSCRYGHVVIARHLILSGARVSSRDLEDMTALHIACLYKQSQVVVLLLENSASVRIVDGKRNSPFHYACRSGDFDSVRLLLQKERISVNAFGEFGTALYEACANGHEKLCHFLIDKGANAKAYGKTGTPLHGACAGDYPSIAKLLLDHGANVTATNRDGDTPLHISCRRAVHQPGPFSTIELLLSRDSGQGLHARNTGARTPLVEVMFTVKESDNLVQIQGGINLHRGSAIFNQENDLHLSSILDRLLTHDSPISDAIYDTWTKEDHFRCRNLVLYYTVAMATLKYRNTFPLKALKYMLAVGEFQGISQMQTHAGIRILIGAMGKEPALLDDVRGHIITPLPLRSLCVASVRRRICKTRRWVSRDLVNSSRDISDEIKRQVLVDGLFTYA
ncbi:ankyrin-3-like [Lineus longissimus]|uniref:ankyrin-3-like n=1 Tax=Lineus longissimus TaxID=88925 RepID=UPI002B4EB2F2